MNECGNINCQEWVRGGIKTAGRQTGRKCHEGLKITGEGEVGT